jgi:hypothetical protein
LIQVAITITDAGEFKVEGPLENPIQMHGMLAMATQAVHEFHAAKTKMPQPRVQLAPGSLMGIKS